MGTIRDEILARKAAKAERLAPKKPVKETVTVKVAKQPKAPKKKVVKEEAPVVVAAVEPVTEVVVETAPETEE